VWRLGVSSRVLWDLETGEALELASELGYTHFELWAEWPRAWPRAMGEGDRERIASEMEGLGLSCSVHATFRDLNLASPNPAVREESVRQAIESIELAADLGARVAVVHPGRMASSRDDPREAWSLLADSLSRVAEAAERLGVVIAVENMEGRPREIVRLPSDLLRLIEEVGSRSLAVTLDASHAGTVGDPIEFVRELGGVVAHVHVSDYSGGRSHLPLGEGSLDLPGFLSALAEVGYSGAVVVEGYVPGRSREVAARSLEIFFRALSSIL